MNNSKVAIDAVLEEEPVFDRKPMLQKQRAEITRIIEAIEGIETTKDWKTLKGLIFDGVGETIERLLATEMKKKPINTPQVYYLQGQLHWAKKYTNLEELKQIYKVELKNIKTQLNG